MFSILQYDKRCQYTKQHTYSTFDEYLKAWNEREITFYYTYQSYVEKGDTCYYLYVSEALTDEEKIEMRR